MTLSDLFLLFNSLYTGLAVCLDLVICALSLKAYYRECLVDGDWSRLAIVLSLPFGVSSSVHIKVSLSNTLHSISLESRSFFVKTSFQLLCSYSRQSDKWLETLSTTPDKLQLD